MSVVVVPNPPENSSSSRHSRHRHSSRPTEAQSRVVSVVLSLFFYLVVLFGHGVQGQLIEVYATIEKKTHLAMRGHFTHFTPDSPGIY